MLSIGFSGVFAELGRRMVCCTWNVFVMFISADSYLPVFDEGNRTLLWSVVSLVSWNRPYSAPSWERVAAPDKIHSVDNSAIELTGTSLGIIKCQSSFPWRAVGEKICSRSDAVIGTYSNPGGGLYGGALILSTDIWETLDLSIDYIIDTFRWLRTKLKHFQSLLLRCYPFHFDYHRCSLSYCFRDYFLQSPSGAS